MCGHSYCMVKSCCCGKELSDGVFIWAIIDVILHLVLVPIPGLLTDIVPHAKFGVGWIALIIFMDVVLAMGCKSNRPAFMTMWMVVVACSIFFLFCLWILLFVGIYLSETNPDGWSPLVKTPSQIASYRLFMGSAVVGMFLLFVMPFVHGYFWFVVRSLRFRLLMEISVGFNSNKQSVRFGKDNVVGPAAVA